MSLIRFFYWRSVGNVNRIVYLFEILILSPPHKYYFQRETLKYLIQLSVFLYAEILVSNISESVFRWSAGIGSGNSKLTLLRKPQIIIRSLFCGTP